ncbi:MAG: glycosyltransferase family 4 protein [Flavobacterium sp.]
MHICFLCNEYPKEGFPHGGFGTFVKTIALQLVNAGVKVSVVGINYESQYEHEVEIGIDIFRIKKHRLKGLSWLLNAKDINKCLKQIHQRTAINIIEASELGLAFTNKLAGVKYVIRLHGGHHFFAEAEKRGIDKWKGFQEKRSFKKADAFIAVSEYVKIHTEKYLSYRGRPLIILSNPIDINVFTPSKTVEVVPYRIVFAGTVCEKKGVRQLIQAFQMVERNFRDSELLIYGRDWFFPDGRSYIDQLKTDFTETELEKVTFMGSVAHSDLPAIYESAQVCVFPSHIETQGLVAPEAMAMEKVVVFSETGPGPETIVDGETGFLVNPYNPADIAEKITFCFENLELTKQIGKNARIAATKKFDPEMILKKNLEFYENLLNI